MDRQYKTFGYYLIELIKLLCFGAVLAWLVSCGSRKQKVINLIHAYEDSIRNCKLRANILNISNDSAITAYHATNPPTLFYYNKHDNARRQQYKLVENDAYKKYIIYRGSIYAQQALLRVRVKEFEKRIDSLKLELYK
jgi:hypothetical protein